MSTGLLEAVFGGVWQIKIPDPIDCICRNLCFGPSQSDILTTKFIILKLVLIMNIDVILLIQRLTINSFFNL